MCGCIYIYGRGHVTGRYQEYIYVMYQTYNKEYIYIYKKKILPYSVSMRIRFKASQKNSILSMSRRWFEEALICHSLTQRTMIIYDLVSKENNGRM